MVHKVLLTDIIYAQAKNYLNSWRTSPEAVDRQQRASPALKKASPRTEIRRST